MRAVWIYGFVVLLAIGGVTAAETGWGQQTGTPVLPIEPLPPDAAPILCMDQFQANKQVNFAVIVDTELGTTSTYSFQYRLGTLNAVMLGLVRLQTGTYNFSDIVSNPDRNLPVRAILHEPKLSGGCYMQIPSPGVYTYWIADPVFTGRPALQEQANTGSSLKQSGSGTTTETWCMWRETWNYNWTILLDSELVYCWQVQVT